MFEQKEHTNDVEAWFGKRAASGVWASHLRRQTFRSIFSQTMGPPDCSMIISLKSRPRRKTTYGMVVDHPIFKSRRGQLVSELKTRAERTDS